MVWTGRGVVKYREDGRYEKVSYGDIRGRESDDRKE
jgi:hypothetical protein